jgi:hypothetical protein
MRAMPTRKVSLVMHAYTLGMQVIDSDFVLSLDPPRQNAWDGFLDSWKDKYSHSAAWWCKIFTALPRRPVCDTSLRSGTGSGRIRKQYRPLRVSAPREISCTHRRSGVLLRCFENTILARCGNMYNSALRDSVDIDAAGSLRFSRSGRRWMCTKIRVLKIDVSCELQRAHSY